MVDGWSDETSGMGDEERKRGWERGFVLALGRSCISADILVILLCVKTTIAIETAYRQFRVVVGKLLWCRTSIVDTTSFQWVHIRFMAGKLRYLIYQDECPIHVISV